MCGGDPNASPWNLLIFVGVGLTAFVNPRLAIMGAHQLVVENILLVLIAVPVMFVQLKLGGLAQKSVLGLFNTHFPLLRGVALLLLVELFYIGTYMPALSVHSICAGFAAVSDERAKMLSCANSWNTGNCWNPLLPPPKIEFGNSNVNLTNIDHMTGHRTAPIAEYFQNEFFQTIYTSFGDFGDLGGFSYGFPVFPIVLVMTWVFVFLIVAFGPRVSGWILSILGILATTLLVAVLGYGWDQIVVHEYDTSTGQMRGSHQMLLYYYLPDWKKLKSAGEWIEFFPQVAYVTLIISGIMPTMGKFAGKGKISRNLSWLFVVLLFPILRHLPVLAIAPYQQRAAEILNMPYSDLFQSHIQPVEAVISLVYSGADRAIVWFYFFANYLYNVCALALYLLVIVDNLVEVLHGLIKRWHWKKISVWVIVTAVVAVIMMLIGIPYTTRGGHAFMQFVDLSLVKFTSFKVAVVASGFIVIYVWQSIYLAEKLIVGSWFIFASACAASLFLQNAAHWFDNFFYDVTTDKWITISWLIPASPFVLIPLGMLVHLLICAVQHNRASNNSVLTENEQPPPYEETLLCERPKTEGGAPYAPCSDPSAPANEDVQIVSGC